MQALLIHIHVPKCAGTTVEQHLMICSFENLPLRITSVASAVRPTLAQFGYPCGGKDKLTIESRRARRRDNVNVTGAELIETATAAEGSTATRDLVTAASANVGDNFLSATVDFFLYDYFMLLRMVRCPSLPNGRRDQCECHRSEELEDARTVFDNKPRNGRVQSSAVRNWLWATG